MEKYFPALERLNNMISFIFQVVEVGVGSLVSLLNFLDSSLQICQNTFCFVEKYIMEMKRYDFIQFSSSKGMVDV